MSSTTLVEAIRPQARLGFLAGVLCCVTAVCQAAPNPQDGPTIRSAQASSDTLSDRQRAIVPIAAFAASGEMHKLGTALNQGLDAGLTVSDVKEVLVQVYAYAGFPRSLNALGEFMAVLDARRQRGIEDAIRRRLQRQHRPKVRSGRVQPRARHMVQIAADHPAVIDRRTIGLDPGKPRLADADILAVFRWIQAGAP